jgi:hypothetical protein
VLSIVLISKVEGAAATAVQFGYGPPVMPAATHCGSIAPTGDVDGVAVEGVFTCDAEEYGTVLATKPACCRSVHCVAFKRLGFDCSKACAVARALPVGFCGVEP